MLTWILAYLALGLFAGFFAGMLGIGGGLVMVPVLTMMFAAQHVSVAHELQMALGTSAAVIIFTSISSLRTHHAHGAVMWNVVKTITPGILAGTACGTLVARLAPTRGLAVFFACFVVFVAVQMILGVKPKPARQLPGALGVSAVGVGIGLVSALVAIGGGSLTVPFLTWCNVKMQHAIGTAAAVGLPIALGSAIGYAINGLTVNGLPAGSVGYIYLPAMAGVMAGSVLTAPLGARTAHRLPVATLKKIFAGVLVVLAVKMVHGVFAS